MRVVITNDYVINSFLLSSIHKFTLISNVDIKVGERINVVSFDLNKNPVITIYPLELREITPDNHYIFYGNAKYRPLTLSEQKQLNKKLKML